MKKHAIVVAALIGAASAQAQVYGTLAAGPSRMSNDCHFTNNSCNSSDVGTKLVGGYAFNNGFSVEASYLNFGRFAFFLAGSGMHPQFYLADEPTAFTLGGGYKLPIAKDWGMNFRLGIARTKTERTTDNGLFAITYSQTKTKAYAGLGMTYALNNNIKFELGADATESELPGVKRTARLVSLGATYAF